MSCGCKLNYRWVGFVVGGGWGEEYEMVKRVWRRCSNGLEGKVKFVNSRRLIKRKNVIAELSAWVSTGETGQVVEISVTKYAIY